MESRTCEEIQHFKTKQLQKYSWSNKSSISNPPMWPNVLDDLLKAEIITGKQLLILKECNSVSYNPEVVMDLRHEQVKRNRLSYGNPLSKHQVTEEARRFVRSEDRKAMLHKKEQILIDREIGALKQQLDRVRTMIKQESCSQTLLKSTPVPAKQPHPTFNSAFVEKSVLCDENTCSSQLQFPQTSHVTLQPDSETDCVIVEKNDMPVLSEKVVLIDSKGASRSSGKCGDGNGDGKDVARHIVELRRRESLRYSWEKWRDYVSEQREVTQASQASNCMLELCDTDLLARYWHQWRLHARRRQRYCLWQSDKAIDPGKIDKFIKSLSEKKLQVQNGTSAKPHSKYKSSVCTSHLAKINQVDNNVSNKLQKSSVYEHRLRAQNNVIAVQKAEIEKQNQVINQLELAKLKLEAEKSRAEANSNLRKTRSSCDISLRAKAKALVSGLGAVDVAAVAPGHSVDVLSRMDQRRRERERRWQFIKEKKKYLEEEKQKELLKVEAERKAKEKEEKLHKIMLLREKCRLEKEQERKREAERAELQLLLRKATSHYNRCLLRKYGMGGWLALMALRKAQLVRAKSHHNTKLMLQCLAAWRLFARQSVESKMAAAAALHRRALLQRSFQRWLAAYDDGTRRVQVASDFHELKIQERTFSHWHQWTCHQHLEMAYKHARAVEHSQRRLLANCLGAWRRLPAMARLHREREKRKCAWRRKVQEVLPDFNPPPT